MHSDFFKGSLLTSLETKLCPGTSLRGGNLFRSFGLSGTFLSMGQPGLLGSHVSYHRDLFWVSTSSILLTFLRSCFLCFTGRGCRLTVIALVCLRCYCDYQGMSLILGVLEACISTNWLQPNSVKTQFVWLGTR